MKRLSQWLRTLASSTWQQCRVAHWLCPLSVWRSASALFALRGSTVVHPKVWRSRMRSCMRCPVYDSRLKRCHNPAQTYLLNGVERPLGCGCWIPVKAKLSDAECWMAEFGHGRWHSVAAESDCIQKCQSLSLNQLE